MGRVDTINQLQAALQSAADTQLVALKFVRNDCAACAATEEAFAELAKAHGEDGQFYTVNVEDAKRLRKLCGIRAVPCGHLYSRGKLVKAMAAGPKAWEPLKIEADAIRYELSGNGHAASEDRSKSPSARWGLPSLSK